MPPSRAGARNPLLNGQEICALRLVRAQSGARTGPAREACARAHAIRAKQGPVAGWPPAARTERNATEERHAGHRQTERRRGRRRADHDPRMTNVHCRGDQPPRIMKIGAGRAVGTSGLYGVAYRSRSARRAPQMASIERPGSSAPTGRGFIAPGPRLFTRQNMTFHDIPMEWAPGSGAGVDTGGPRR